MNAARKTATPATPRWKRRREARPAEILAAALDLFVDRGFAATRVDDIAARAGVTKGTVYLYFSSKEELLQAAIEQSLAPTADQVEALGRTHEGSAEDLLRSLLGTWWDVLSRWPNSGIPKLVISEAGNFPAIAARYAESLAERGRAAIGSALERGVASGEFRALQTEHAVRVAVAPFTTFVIYRHSIARHEKRGPDFDAMARLHIEVFLRGIRADAKA